MKQYSCNLALPKHSYWALLLTLGLLLGGCEGKNEESLLLYTVQIDRPQKVEELIKKGVNVNFFDNVGMTPLMFVAYSGRLEMAKLLVANGAKIDVKRQFLGQTALMWAAYQGNDQMAQFLIDQGASVNAKDNKGWTALMFAIKKNRIKTAQLLLSKGAELEIKNQYGDTALSLAQQNGDKEMLELLQTTHSIK